MDPHTFDSTMDTHRETTQMQEEQKPLQEEKSEGVGLDAQLYASYQTLRAADEARRSSGNSEQSMKIWHECYYACAELTLSQLAEKNQHIDEENTVLATALAAANARINQLESQQDGLNHYADTIKAELAAEGSRLEGMQAILREREDELATVRTDLRDALADRDAAQHTADEATKTLSTRDAELAAARSTITDLETRADATKKTLANRGRKLSTAKTQLQIVETQLLTTRDALQDHQAIGAARETSHLAAIARLDARVDKVIAAATARSIDLDARLAVSRRAVGAFRDATLDLDAQLTAAQSTLAERDAQLSAAQCALTTRVAQFAAGNERIADAFAYANRAASELWAAEKIRKGRRSARAELRREERRARRTKAELREARGKTARRDERIGGLEAELSALRGEGVLGKAPPRGGNDDGTEEKEKCGVM